MKKNPAKRLAPRRILLAAGGTGGHIWPALTFGAWINKRHPECEVRYICGSRALEREIYTAAAANPIVLPLEGSPLAGNGLLHKAERLQALVKSYGKAFSVVRKFSPDVALLFGGYLSLPVIAACYRMGIRCALHEQNSRAGKITRLAAKLGMEIYSGWSECAPLSYKKFIRTGVPVRDFDLPDRDEAWKGLGLNGKAPEGPIVVVMTGSLGSRTLTEDIRSVAKKGRFRAWTFIIAAVAEEIEYPSQNIVLLPKIWNAALLYAIADILVVRGGGSTLTEASMLGLPTLVVPWMRASDNHQFYNALAFAGENRCLIWTEDKGKEELVSSLVQLNTTDENIYQNKAAVFPERGDAICENLWSMLFSAL